VEKFRPTKGERCPIMVKVGGAKQQQRKANEHRRSLASTLEE